MKLVCGTFECSLYFQRLCETGDTTEMPNTLSFSMEYRSRLSLLQTRAVFSMLCKSEIENDIDVKISVWTNIHNFYLVLHFTIFILFCNKITFPTPPETCIADSEDGVTINTLHDFNGILSISISIGAFERCDKLGFVGDWYKFIPRTLYKTYMRSMSQSV